MFYDDETANSQYRICSLGYEAVNESDTVLDPSCSPVDSESEFRITNISIREIHSAEIVDTLTYPEIYTDGLKRLLSEWNDMRSEVRSKEITFERYAERISIYEDIIRKNTKDGKKHRTGKWG